MVTSAKSFKEIKQLTGASDGNISVQVSRLEEMEYLTTTKKFIGKKPCTTYALTAAGIENFIAYVEMMKQLLAQKSDS